jgi:hypothetical protein
VGRLPKQRQNSIKTAARMSARFAKAGKTKAPKVKTSAAAGGAETGRGVVEPAPGGERAAEPEREREPEAKPEPAAAGAVRSIDKAKLDKLMAAVERHLRKEHAKGGYRWPITSLPKIVGDMRSSLEAGQMRSVSIDGAAWKAALKELKIKPTYKALAEYLASV